MFIVCMKQTTYAKANLIAELRSTLKDYAKNPDVAIKGNLKKRIEGLQNELDIPFNESEFK